MITTPTRGATPWRPAALYSCHYSTSIYPEYCYMYVYNNVYIYIYIHGIMLALYTPTRGATTLWCRLVLLLVVVVVEVVVAVEVVVVVVVIIVVVSSRSVIVVVFC